MTNRFEVSQSKVKLWRQCRFAYHEKYVEGLTKLVKSRPLQFGIIVHEMLEASFKGQDPFAVLDAIALEGESLFSAEKEMYGEIIEDVRLIMEAYFDFYADDKTRPIRYNKEYAEHWIELPIGEELLFVGKIDVFLRTPNKLRWLTDHKTFKRAPSDDDRWRNLQSAVYLTACEELGIKPFDGFMWNYINSKPPTVPQVLQSGVEFSARAINTLPATVRKAMRDNDIGLTLGAQKLLERAESNVSNYFFRVFTPVNSSVRKMIWDDFVDTAIEMAECHGKKADRNIGMHCSWCDYEHICRASLTGGDVDMVKEREYESREERHEREEKATKAKAEPGRKGTQRASGKKRK